MLDKLKKSILLIQILITSSKGIIKIKEPTSR